MPVGADMVLVDVVVVAFGVGLVATRIDLTQPLFSPLAKRVCVPFLLGRFLLLVWALEKNVSKNIKNSINTFFIRILF